MFSKIDLSDAYLQIEVDEESSKLLNINTHRGLYKYTSKTKTEHRNHIINVFGKLQEYGFKVKEAKCDFFLPEIKYLGHIINRDSRRPDPERANVIRNMPAPDNVQALQSLLGQANFYQGFIKNMQNLREPLNELLKKDKPWLWTPEFQESF